MHYSAKRGLAIACRLSVCLSVRPSVTLVNQDHIGWKSWKLIARTISPTSSLFVAQRSSTYSQENMEKFWGENVRSTPTSITSGWSESNESHVILGGGVAVCLLLSAHRAVIFVIAQLSCSTWMAPGLQKWLMHLSPKVCFWGESWGSEDDWLTMVDLKMSKLMQWCPWLVDLRSLAVVVLYTGYIF